MREVYLKKRDVEIRKRPKESHKGQHGRCLVIGGCERYAGAPGLAGMAALRAGCDIVEIAAPENVAWTINAYSPDLITLKIPGRNLSTTHMKKLKGYIKDADAVLLGNGLGKRDQFVRACIEEIQRQGKHLVLDGDAIGAVALQRLRHCIMTPHAGEAERLAEVSGIRNDVKELQSVLQGDSVILLKGAIDTIISEGRVFLNRTGNAAMAKAGTGDVLAGMCAGFLAQGHSMVQSCINASYLMGHFGDMVFRDKGYALTATDIIERMKIP